MKIVELGIQRLFSFAAKTLVIHFSAPHSVRSERYSHEFNSDEEEDVDSAKLRSSFHNFTSTAPRMSAYLDETKLRYMYFV